MLPGAKVFASVLVKKCNEDRMMRPWLAAFLLARTLVRALPGGLVVKEANSWRFEIVELA